MSEQELIAQFAKFGYLVMKTGTTFSIFDRRCGRKISDSNDLSQLANYAENIFLFPFWTNVLENTVNFFVNGASSVPVTDMVTGEKDPGEYPERQESPVIPDNPDSPIYDLVCKGCGKHFQSPRKRAYCSEACYPSNQDKKPIENAVEVFQRPV